MGGDWRSGGRSGGNRVAVELLFGKLEPTTCRHLHADFPNDRCRLQLRAACKCKQHGMHAAARQVSGGRLQRVDLMGYILWAGHICMNINSERNTYER